MQRHEANRRAHIGDCLGVGDHGVKVKGHFVDRVNRIQGEVVFIDVVDAKEHLASS